MNGKLAAIKTEGGSIMKTLFRTTMILAVLAAFVGMARAQDEAYPDASRIVAIGGSLTEIIYALGEEDRLIARDTTSMFPPEALSLPDVGYIRALSAEGVLSVSPDLILALEGSGPPEAIAVLEAASVPIVFVPDRFDAKGIAGKIRAVGEVLGVADKAKELVEKVSQDLAAAEAAGATASRKKVLFVLSTQGGKILASGSGTSADGMIRMAGGENAVTAFSGYKQVADEAIIEAAPDVILMMNRTGSVDHAVANAELFSHPAISTTPAAASKSVVRMDGLYLLGFGPRTAQAVRDLAAALKGTSG